MAHPDGEAVSDAGSSHDVFAQFLDAPQATPEDLQETQEVPSYEDSGEPEEAEAVAEVEQEETVETDSDEPPSEAIDPPLSWSKEDKEYFKSLPPEVQRVVASRERQRDGYLNQRAEAIANERKEMEALKAEAEKARQELADRLSKYRPQLPEEPDASLIETDPITYMKQQREYDAAVKADREARAELERLTKEQQQKAEQDYQVYVKSQAELLKERLPDFVDKDKGPALQAAVRDYALKSGYTDAQLAMVSATDVITLNKARLFDEMSARKVPEKLREVPKVTTPGQKRSKTETDAEAHRDRMSKLRKTGDLKDAAAVFRDFL